MPKFYNHDMADLAHQLTLSPRRLRMEQIRGLEKLLALIDPERAYPFDLICYTITGYRKKGPRTSASVPGKALIGDLVSMAELITRRANLSVAEIEGRFETHGDLATQLGATFLEKDLPHKEQFKSDLLTEVQQALARNM